MRIARWRPEALAVSGVLAGACGPQVAVPGIDGSASGGSSEGSVTASGWGSGDATSSGPPLAPDVGAADPCAELVVVDPDLELALREALVLAPDVVITGDTLAPLTTLAAQGAGIDDLRGLECAHALERLSLAELDDGDPMVNQVTDLGPLRDLPGLVTVELGFNAVTQVVPLRAVTWLQLQGNPLTSVADLVGSDALTSLNLDQTDVADPTPLAQLPALATLSARNTPLTDLSGLAGSNALVHLDIVGTAVDDLSVAAQLPALESLAAGHTAVVDISGLAGSDSLAWLEISQTDVADLAVIAQLPALQELHIGQTQVADLGVLEGRPLDMLAASAIAITALPEHLVARQVVLTSNGITDLTPMITWEPPEHVELGNNAIDDVTPLLAMPWAELDFCVHVDLRDNPLGSPDTATVVQQACDAQMIELDAGPELSCSNPDCPP